MIPLGLYGAARPVASGGPVVLASDAFTRSGTLAGSTADTGQTWTTPVGTWTTTGAEATNSLNTRATALVDVGQADMAVEAVVAYTGSGSAQAGVCARYDGSNQDGYLGQVNTVAAYIYREVSGTATQIAAATGLSFTHPTTVRLVVDGATQELYADGVLVCSATDSAITTGTQGGLRNQTARANNRYDDLLIEAP